jgi:hypothetical protein
MKLYKNKAINNETKKITSELYKKLIKKFVVVGYNFKYEVCLASKKNLLVTTILIPINSIKFIEGESDESFEIIKYLNHSQELETYFRTIKGKEYEFDIEIAPNSKNTYVEVKTWFA